MTTLPDRVGCYRHPDHLTGTHCTRCGRPVCADCLAGSECPTCLAELAAPPASRSGTSSLVAELLSVTPAVAVLIAASAFVFVLTRLHRAWQVGAAQVPDLVARGEQYRLLTAVFVHVDGTHLLFNMAALFVVGPPVERSLGTARFLLLYLVAGTGGFVVSFLFGPEAVASVGASGAIFGVFGAWFFIARARGRDTAAIGLLITLLLTFSFYQASIDWRAHVGGLITGAVLGAAFAAAGPRGLGDGPRGLGDGPRGLGDGSVPSASVRSPSVRSPSVRSASVRSPSVRSVRSVEVAVTALVMALLAAAVVVRSGQLRV